MTIGWELHEKFICRCGTPSCYGERKGLKYLSHEEQETLLPFLTGLDEVKDPQQRMKAEQGIGKLYFTH